VIDERASARRAATIGTGTPVHLLSLRTDGAIVRFVLIVEDQLRGLTPP